MDVKAYVRGLDREEEQLRMEIMRIQVRIQQLNDMKVMMMRRAEEDAAAHNQPSPFGMLNGAEIAVRDPVLTLTASEAGLLSQAAKTGEQSATVRRQPMTKRVFELLQEGKPPMSSFEIRQALNLDADDAKRRLHGALHTLKSRGQINWDDQHRYFRVPGAALMSPQQAGARRHHVRAASKPDRAAVENLIAVRGPLATGEIVKAVFGDRKYDKKERDKIYAVLHNIRTAKTGALMFDGERYRQRGEVSASA